MILLAFLSILFLFFLLFTSYNFGEFLLDKCRLSLNKWLMILVGYLGFVMMFQLLYYPAQWFQLPSFYLGVTGGIFLFVCLVFDLFHLQNVKKVFGNKAIWIIFLLAFVLFFFYMRTLPHDYWYFDDSFYLPYMYDNAHANRILMIEPRSGFEVSKLNPLYSYQAYYLMGSFFILLFDFLGSIFSFSFHYLSVVHYFLSMPTFVLLLISFYGMGQMMSKERKSRFLYYGLCVFYSVFLPYFANILNNVYMNGYIGIFALGTIFMPMIVSFLHAYMKGDRRYVPLLFISFFAMISYASFSMFLVFVSLFTMLLYQILKKEEIHFSDYFVMAVALVVYCFSFVFHEHSVFILPMIVLYLLFLVGYDSFERKSKTFHLKMISFASFGVKFCLVLFLLGSFLFSVLGVTSATVIDYLSRIITNYFPVYSNTEFYYFFIPITLFYLFTVFVFFFLVRKNRSLSCHLWWIALIMGVFLNPLTISFVSTCLTGDAYERIFILIFNPYIFFLLYEEFIHKHFPYPKLVTLGMICLLSVPPLLLLKDFHYWVMVKGGSDKLTRLAQVDIDGAKAIMEVSYLHHISKPLLATNIKNEYRVYDPNIQMLYTRLYSFEPDDKTTFVDYQIDVFYHFLNGQVSNYDLIKYGNILDIVKNNHISFFVWHEEDHTIHTDPTFEQEYQSLMDHSTKIYSAGGYEIYYTGVDA